MTEAPKRWIETAHADAPVDDQGRPVHPDDDRDVLICGHEKSDKTSPTEHGRERDDVPYCTLVAGWGTDRDVGCCRKHGAVKSSRKGPLNPNHRHGLYSQIDADEYSQEDLELLDELDGTDEVDLLEQLIRIHALRYERAHGALPTGVTIERTNVDALEQPYRRIELQPGELQLAQLGSQLASLIQRYHKITEGETLHVDGEHEITGDASITVEWKVAQREKDSDDVDVELLEEGEEIEID